jgi:hypothetical protein
VPSDASSFVVILDGTISCSSVGFFCLCCRLSGVSLAGVDDALVSGRSCEERVEISFHCSIYGVLYACKAIECKMPFYQDKCPLCSNPSRSLKSHR